MSAAPFLKWAGGKTRLIPELLARVPKDYGCYREPFLGGGALFFALQPQCAVLSDANHDLISTYAAVACRVDEVIADLDAFTRSHSATFYRSIRAQFNDRELVPGSVARAAAFTYLNKTCFNGLWRVNAKGEFNVPMGDASSSAICNPEALRAASSALRHATLWGGDYAAMLSAAKPGDFVYLDPPYDSISDTANFTGYTVGGFGQHEHATLARDALELVGRGVKVMLSNADTPLISELYGPPFTLHEVTARRSISAKGSSRVRVGELIITGGYAP